MIYQICPMSKPRMTQRDKWSKRKVVQDYWNFKDRIKQLEICLDDNGQHIIFHIPMPKSWSNKKKEEMNSKPHKQRPDVDNFCKGLFDAIFEEDSSIWDIRISKQWAYEGAIEIRSIDNEK